MLHAGTSHSPLKLPHPNSTLSSFSVLGHLALDMGSLQWGSCEPGESSWLVLPEVAAAHHGWCLALCSLHGDRRLQIFAEMKLDFRRTRLQSRASPRWDGRIPAHLPLGGKRADFLTSDLAPQVVQVCDSQLSGPWTSTGRNSSTSVFLGNAPAAYGVALSIFGS